MENRIYDIIGKIFQGSNLSSEDDAIFSSWIKQPGNETIYAEMKSAWELTGNFKQPEDADLDLEWERFNQLKSTIKPIRKISWHKYAVAASVALLLGIMGIIMFNNNAIINVVADNCCKELVLPDGSQVYMNQNTTIIYNKHFGKDNRRIELQGEAFFEVQHNEKLTFEINSPGGLSTKVLGTKFNLRAYPNEPVAKLSVISGRVSFGKSNEANPTVFIVNQQAEFQRESGQVIMKSEIDKNACAWHTRKLVFDNQVLSEVVITISQFLNMQILYPDSCKTYKFSGKFSNPTPEEFATIIDATYGFTHEISGQQLIFKVSDK